MLDVIKEFTDEVRAEGKREGKREGAQNLNFVYADLFRQGREDDVRRSVEDPEYLKIIMAEYGINDDVEAEAPN